MTNSITRKRHPIFKRDWDERHVEFVMTRVWREKRRRMSKKDKE